MNILFLEKKGSNWLSSKIPRICGLLGLNLSVALIQYIYWYTSQGPNDWWLKPSSYIGRPTSIALMAAVNHSWITAKGIKRFDNQVWLQRPCFQKDIFTQLLCGNKSMYNIILSINDTIRPNMLHIYIYIYALHTNFSPS